MILLLTNDKLDWPPFYFLCFCIGNKKNLIPVGIYLFILNLIQLFL